MGFIEELIDGLFKLVGGCIFLVIMAAVCGIIGGTVGWWNGYTFGGSAFWSIVAAVLLLSAIGYFFDDGEKKKRSDVQPQQITQEDVMGYAREVSNMSPSELRNEFGSLSGYDYEERQVVEKVQQEKQLTEEEILLIVIMALRDAGFNL